MAVKRPTKRVSTGHPRGPQRRLLNGLTSTEAAFVDAVIECKNQTEAYRRIAPHVKNPAQAATNYMARPRVRGEIERRQAIAAQRSQVTLDDLAKELAKIAMANMDDFSEITEDGERVINWSKINAMSDEKRRDRMAAVSKLKTKTLTVGRGKDRKKIGIECELGLWPKVEAIVKLGQHLGGFKTGLELGNARRPDGTQEPFKVQEVPADPLEAAKLYQAIVEGRD